MKDFRNKIETSPGHAHLYSLFDQIMAHLVDFRETHQNCNSELAMEIINTISALVKENSEGRRPWEGGWEYYFEKCMENAYRLMKEFELFPDFMSYCPRGWCNTFLNAYKYMDGDADIFEEHKNKWVTHFYRLASMAAEMFCIIADENVIILAELLECPDDQVFTWLLTGYAKSRSPTGKVIIEQYVDDEELFVRVLAKNLLNTYYH